MVRRFGQLLAGCGIFVIGAWVLFIALIAVGLIPTLPSGPDWFGISMMTIILILPFGGLPLALGWVLGAFERRKPV